MKINKVLDNFRNVKEYILLLPIQEQIKEINKMIECHTNYNHPRAQIKKKYTIINQCKDFKMSLTAYNLQQIHDNPTVVKYTPPLHVVLEARFFFGFFINM